jgi:drug/metabolite transporter (DMT)-like permease
VKGSRALLVGLALAVVYVVWGSTYFAIALGIGADDGAGEGLPPFVLASVRFLLAGAVLFAWAVRRPAADGLPDPLGWAQWRACLVVGGFLLLGGNGLVVLSELRIDSGLTSVAVATVPLWTALLAAAAGQERLPPVAVAGVVLGFAGVAVMLSGSFSGRIDTVGLLMALTAAVCWGFGSWWSRGAPLPRRPLVMTAMEMLCGGALMAVVALVRGEYDFDPGAVGAAGWWALAYLTVFGSMLAFTCYVWLLRNARLSLVTTYAYVNPVVAVGLGVLLLDERLTARTLVATAVTLAGVALIVMPRSEARTQPGSPSGAPSREEPADQLPGGVARQL